MRPTRHWIGLYPNDWKPVATNCKHTSNVPLIAAPKSTVGPLPMDT